MISAASELNEPGIQELVVRVAKFVDRKFQKYQDSCRSFLYCELPRIAEKLNHQLQNERLLFTSLSNKAKDYYYKQHQRHVSRELPIVEEMLEYETARSLTFGMDINGFIEGLLLKEKEVWPVVIGEKRGIDVANELGIAPQTVSKRVCKLRARARVFFKEYDHERD